MPQFCRHGALAERCPICQASLEEAARSQTAQPPARSRSDTRPRSNLSSRGRMTVRREVRAEDDGYRSQLAPGLRSTTDAARLAAEIAFAAGRLQTLESDPPGLYREIMDEANIEEATWLALLVAYLGPLNDAEPFAAIEAVRTPWGTLPDLEGALIGPRGSHVAARGTATLVSYQRFTERAGSQAAAITADPVWSPQQRFERLHERLALPGLHRRARYDLLVTLGRLGRYPLAAPALLLVEDDEVLLAAKRVFGIGDRLTLERRSSALARAVDVPVEALDLALENWAAPERITQGVPDAADDDAEERARAALGC